MFQDSFFQTQIFYLANPELLADEFDQFLVVADQHDTALKMIFILILDLFFPLFFCLSDLQVT